MRDIPPKVRAAVYERSGGQCEAYDQVGPPGDEVWLRCGRRGEEVQHALPRSRGGRILDAAGEIAHLLHLCRPHHRIAHHEPTRGLASGLVIGGYVTTGPDGRPRYTGPNPYLTEKYGDRDAPLPG